MTGAKFGEASLATKGEDADIKFDDADLTVANFTEASLTTESGAHADIHFDGASLVGADFTKASLVTEGNYSEIAFDGNLTGTSFEEASLTTTGAVPVRTRAAASSTAPRAPVRLGCVRRRRSREGDPPRTHSLLAGSASRSSSSNAR